MNYYHLHVQVNSPVKPKVSLISSTIRGTYGHFLKSQTCIEPSYDCDTCTHTSTCLYHTFYNKRGNTPPPFRVEAALHSSSYDFSFYIFDEDPAKLRPLINALRTMLQTRTITDDKLSFPRSDIYLNNEKVRFNTKNILLPFKSLPKYIENIKYHQDIELEILTPLYIKNESSFKRSVELKDILFSIHKRKSSLEKGKQDVSALPFEPVYTCLSSELKVFKEKTRSHDQNKDLALLGVVGKMVFTQLDKKSFALLKYGEVLALGNKVVKGQGVIRLNY